MAKLRVNNNSKYCTNEIDLDLEILKAIKDVLLKKHPIVDDRLDYLFGSGEFDIALSLYDYQGNAYSIVSFLDGTENARMGIVDSVKLNERFSINLVNNLIFYILTDHEIISEFYKTSNSIEMKFRVDLKNENMKGISCRTIGLSLHFYGDADMESYKELYFKDIITIFFEKLKDTQYMKNEFNNYVSNVKKELLSKSSKEDILEFLSKLSVEELEKIIEAMDPYFFMNILNSIRNKSGNQKQISLQSN